MKTVLAAYSAVLRGVGSAFSLALRELPWVSQAYCFQVEKPLLEKQLQLFAVLQWLISAILMGAVSTVALLYLCTTDFWVIPAMYSAWLILDWNTPTKGGRRFSRVRGWSMWNHFRDYFPIRLVKTCSLPPSRNYIFGYHPHGIFSFGAFCNFATEANDFSKKFPGIKPFVATLAGNFRLPVAREYLMAAGICPVSRSTIKFLLSHNGTGNAVVIVVGGAAESLNCTPGTNSVILKNRKGFVKLALQQGADLVPVYAFGENDVYRQVIFTEGSWWRRVQRKLQKWLGVAPCVFLGRGLLSADSWGMVPYSRPITSVVGEPIPVPRIEEPCQKVLDQYHGLYVDSLRKLFDAHKTRFGLKDTDVLEVE